MLALKLGKAEYRMSTAEAEDWLKRAMIIKYAILTQSYGCKRGRDGSIAEVLREEFLPQAYVAMAQQADQIVSAVEQCRSKAYPLFTGSEFNKMSGQNEFRTRHQVTESADSVYEFGYTEILEQKWQTIGGEQEAVFKVKLDKDG